MPSVLLCLSQLARLPDQGASLKQGCADAGAQVGGMACLGLCYPCGQQPVARFDGTPLTAPTPDELVAQVTTLVTGE